VRHLHLAPRAFLPMRELPELTLIAGIGVQGDRYMLGRETGYYSHLPEEGRQVTLFEIETLWALKRDHGIEFTAAEHRRNVTVEGVPLTHLVGRRFWLGETLVEATRLSIPCRHIEEVTGKTIFDPLINRSGLNCKILQGGIVRTGDPLSPA
jgi:MOSC domain-containing protein YiiM